MAYTTAQLVQYELRAASEFSATTEPSLSTVTTWIDQTDSYIDNLSRKVYNVSSYTDIFNYSGEGVLFLKNTPVVSITSVEYDSSSLTESPSWITLTEYTHYKVDVAHGSVTLYPSRFSSGIKDGVNRFRVVYSSGYSSIPGNVQMLATKLVTSRVLESLINDNVNSRADGGSISIGTIRIVEPASYGVNSFKTLKSDIKQLETDVLGGFRVYRYG